ncbi:MAG: T9SS type A sorting domain-containing protein [Chitinophagaceae bacterium]|nr:T9SS type A sorting domain-containing protein [Chitinophagaceae bacterium]
MMKTGILLLFSFFPLFSFSQCLTALPPPGCNGTEPLATDGETISTGTTKWYYGATVTMNSLTLDGGTLVVCGDLTIDRFYMNTGNVFIRQGGRLVIGSGIGAGLQLRGGCAIYNYGTCEIQRNLSLENNATAISPNRVINALTTSVFKMSNQYFVINNAHSWFVNNGYAEFWGIITDNQSSAGSVCLGNRSITRMAVLINKVANTYNAPDGNACVNVYQFSEFYGQLTSSASLLVCLGSGHSSNSGCILFGCTPNNWGVAQVFTNCTGCGTLAALTVSFTSFTAGSHTRSVMLQWQMNSTVQSGLFRVLRSSDGSAWDPIDSLSAGQNNISVYNYTDQSPLRENAFYMIQYTNPLTGMMMNSKIIKMFTGIMAGFHLYPVPFDNKFFINYEPGANPEKILLTDLAGRDIRAKYTIREGSQSVEVIVLDNIQPGLYIVHMQTSRNVVAKTIFKR